MGFRVRVTRAEDIKRQPRSQGLLRFSRWRGGEDPGTHRYAPREILHESWSILSRDTQ